MRAIGRPCGQYFASLSERSSCTISHSSGRVFLSFARTALLQATECSRSSSACGVVSFHRHLAHNQVAVAKLLHQKARLLKQRQILHRSLIILTAQVHHHRLEQQLTVVGEATLL